ncbi:regulator of competence TfoX [Lactiplantibacillus fabifermentans T30PCM01]|uniref:Regulator of competence TfoX n=1 Tax=Lactiplantibacillus fabifermentans T30PCM01 TaxID=1400520 RepID=W6T3S0_9LACO|nr:TfoX/Sxy family protein [Lactiplantibacillus fabifermentans]ETY72526.1 regulator of competence TfoX [Lactiplantibacillus fabifermentans T30PCM01]
MSTLTDLPNIGPRIAQQLAAIGVTTPAELHALGSKTAFQKIKAQDNTACIQQLYSLQGAIENQKYTQLADQTKTDLTLYFRSLS